MDQFVTNLKRQAEENPVLAMGVAAGLTTAVSQLINSLTNAKNASAWKKEVDRRVKNATQK